MEKGEKENGLPTTRSESVFSDEDTKLMLSAGQGDVNAFENLYIKYFPIVSDFITSRNGSISSTEDLTQEVFVRLWEFRHHFRANSTFKTYVFGIARNVVLDEWKRLSRKLPDHYQERLKRITEAKHDLSDPEMEMYRLEVSKIVREAVSQLTDKQKQAFRQVFIERRSIDEIMSQTNYSRKALERRLDRIRRRFREILLRLKP